MLFTLHEALQQIDPQVVLDDGQVARTVEQIIFSIDPLDFHDYVIDVDSWGRLMIFQIDYRGHPLLPARFIEQKAPSADKTPTHIFGSPVPQSFILRLA